VERDELPASRPLMMLPPAAGREEKKMGEVTVQKTDSLWNQIQDMESRVMRRAYDIFHTNGSLFGRDLDDWLTAEREFIWKPAIEVAEKDNHFEIKVAVAGVDPKDLKVEITDEELLVRSETKSEKKDEERDKGRVHVSEFQSGSLFRSVHLPKKIDPNKVKADFKNGLLTVNAPIAEAQQPRKIEIQAA